MFTIGSSDNTPIKEYANYAVNADNKEAAVTLRLGSSRPGTASTSYLGTAIDLCLKSTNKKTVADFTTKLTQTYGTKIANFAFAEKERKAAEIEKSYFQTAIELTTEHVLHSLIPVVNHSLKSVTLGVSIPKTTREEEKESEKSFLNTLQQSIKNPLQPLLERTADDAADVLNEKLKQVNLCFTIPENRRARQPSGALTAKKIEEILSQANHFLAKQVLYIGHAAETAETITTALESSKDVLPDQKVTAREHTDKIALQGHEVILCANKIFSDTHAELDLINKLDDTNDPLINLLDSAKDTGSKIEDMLGLALEAQTSSSDFENLLNDSTLTEAQRSLISDKTLSAKNSAQNAIAAAQALAKKATEIVASSTEMAMHLSDNILKKNDQTTPEDSFENNLQTAIKEAEDAIAIIKAASTTIASLKKDIIASSEDELKEINSELHTLQKQSSTSRQFENFALRQTYRQKIKSNIEASYQRKIEATAFNKKIIFYFNPNIY